MKNEVNLIFLVMLKTLLEETLVVLPARGGSKRIAKKNIKSIHGNPMIYWPLSVLSRIFKPENIIVSTECNEIKKVVEKTGLQIPYARPLDLANDFTSTTAVTKHALDWYLTNVKYVRFVLTVYPTAVLLNEDDIITALEHCNSDPDCHTVISACRYNRPVQRALYEGRNGYAKMFWPENYKQRSQDLAEAHYDAGQFYLSKTDALLCTENIFDHNVKLMLLDPDKAVDIDNHHDFLIAEKLLIKQRESVLNFSWFGNLT